MIFKPAAIFCLFFAALVCQRTVNTTKQDTVLKWRINRTEQIKCLP
jgi:hypothetical protein